MATPVQMPKQGNTVTECLIVEWKVEEGSTVGAGDILCAIETDKATFDVESPAAGTLLARFVNAGELAPVLTNIAAIGEPGENVDSLRPESATPAGEKGASAQAVTTAAPARAKGKAAASPATGDGVFRISPRARALAAREGVEASELSGSGPQGRILAADVEAAAEARGRLTPLARAQAAQGGWTAERGTGPGGRVRVRDLVPTAKEPQPEPIRLPEGVRQEIPYTGIRKLIGERMRASLLLHAQLTLNASADATAILAARKAIKADQSAPPLTLNDMIAWVVVRTLTEFPELNALFDMAGERLVQFNRVHLGMAVDTPRGLMVPVVRNAEAMGQRKLSSALAGLAEQCRSGRIDPDLLSGGTFTITNLGAMGIESFTPVLNSPQVAILGVCSILPRAVPEGEAGVRFRPTLGLSLTIDHQVVDGAPAARFLQKTAEGIAAFERETA